MLANIDRPNYIGRAWVTAEVLKLMALASNSFGGRVIAVMSNMRFLSTNASVGKTYFAHLRKESQFDTAQLRKQFRAPPNPCEPNQT